MDYSFLEAFYARLSTERRKKTGTTTTTTTTVAKIAIHDEFSFRMERGQGSRVSDCRDDLQRRRSFPGITAAFSGVPYFERCTRPEFAELAGISLADLTES